MSGLFRDEEVGFAGEAERRESTMEGRESESPSSAGSHESSSGKRQTGKCTQRKKVSGGERRVRGKRTAKKDATSCSRQNSRSRRLVANARERSRIHILSDAFENLRRAVPSYSQDQKLSKLAILKLATYYISALANLAENDTSARSLKQFADCVTHCTKALQSEGRARRKQY